MSTKKNLFTLEEMVKRGFPKETLFKTIFEYRTSSYFYNFQEKEKELVKVAAHIKELFNQEGIFVEKVKFDVNPFFNLSFEKISLTNNSPLLERVFGDEFSNKAKELIELNAIAFEFYNAGNKFFMSINENFDSSFENRELRENFLNRFDEKFEQVFSVLDNLQLLALKEYISFCEIYDSSSYEFGLYEKDSECFNHLRFTEDLDVID